MCSFPCIAYYMIMKVNRQPKAWYTVEVKEGWVIHICRDRLTEMPSGQLEQPRRIRQSVTPITDYITTIKQSTMCIYHGLYHSPTETVRTVTANVLPAVMSWGNFICFKTPHKHHRCQTGRRYCSYVNLSFRHCFGVKGTFYWCEFNAYLSLYSPAAHLHD